MIGAAMKRRLAMTAVIAACAAAGLTACGSEQVDVPDASASVQRGAQLFSERCSGCHSMTVAGAQGSAISPSDKERVDGPDFDVRQACYEDTLYAIQNGGYSGAIMPANIVVGKDAQDVAAFIAEYSGQDREEVASPSGPAEECPPPPGG
jgi:mono/diheme cytochrome c family protein